MKVEKSGKLFQENKNLLSRKKEFSFCFQSGAGGGT